MCLSDLWSEAPCSSTLLRAALNSFLSRCFCAGSCIPAALNALSIATLTCGLGFFSASIRPALSTGKDCNFTVILLAPLAVGFTQPRKVAFKLCHAFFIKTLGKTYLQIRKSTPTTRKKIVREGFRNSSGAGKLFTNPPRPAPMKSIPTENLSTLIMRNYECRSILINVTLLATKSTINGRCLKIFCLNCVRKIPKINLI